MRFYSPFINMFMLDDDYIALLRDFRHRLSLPLKHVGTSYDEGSKLHYPIFSLGGTHLHMNHYADRAFAEEKWQERLQRLNKEHLFFMMFTERPNIAEAFDALPYDRKVCFTSFPTDLPSAMYVKPYAACQKPLGKPFWQTINGMANGTYPYYDIYELLMHEKKTYRSV